MTPFVWMFIKTYEKLREYIINRKSIISLIQMEYSAFEEATVPICSYVLQNCRSDNKSLCFRLSDFKGGMDVQKEKVLEAIKNPNCGYFYEAEQSNYSKIPGSPVAYWVSEKILQCYTSKTIYDYATPCKGIDTGDNNVFLRLWYEVDIYKQFIPNGEKCKSIDFETKKWFPYNKGGNFRRWYGNNEYLLNWESNGAVLKSFKGSNLRNKDRYFNRGITWSTVTSGKSSFRYFDYGFLFDNGGSCLFASCNLMYIQGLLNSVVSSELLTIQPTINNQPGTIGSIPLVIKNVAHVEEIVDDNIILSRKDWDSFETSWDFQQHPLVRWSRELWDATAIGAQISYYYGVHPEVSCPLELCFLLWQGECSERFQQLKANEEELNRIFIDIYGLQDELMPEVEDKDVTVYRIFDDRSDIPDSMGSSKYALTKQDVVKSLISYAVGCMFGRYSLDVDGLAYAGGEWDSSKYVTYPADKDNIIPICDDEYFDDDIVGRFVTFIEVVYGKETLEDNLKFIADALGGKDQPKDVIRNYFIKDFYKDHCKTYQKRPIYWLFDSGKKNGFKALIYMHRYQPDIIARIRTDYVHEQQSRYHTAIDDIEQRLQTATSSDRVKLNKALKKLTEQDTELRTYEEKIHHLADQMIPIDLDDGVKKNYAIFQDVLAKIK